MSKTKIGAAVAASVMALALFASFAGAQTAATSDKDKGNADGAMKMAVQINASGHAQLAGTVAAVQSASFTVKSWGGVWTVNAGSDAKFVRRFGGNSGLSELAVGDFVTVTGAANQSSPWTVDAKNVRDVSIQAKNASFSGTISDLSGSNFSFATKERGSVKVTVNSDAKIYVNGKSGAVSDLANGMIGQVGGVWDRTQSTVMASRVNVRVPRVKPVSGGSASSTSQH